MFDDNLLYRKNMLVNWSCHLQSTISDYEVDYINLEEPTKITVSGYDEPVEFGTIVDFSYKVMGSGEAPILSRLLLAYYGENNKIDVIQL